MSDSDRRRTFATALAGTLAAVSIVFTVWAYRHVSEYQGEQAKERQSASDNYRREAEQRIEFCIQAVPEERSSERLECLSNAIDAAEDSATAKHDLKAQQDMSAWALGVLYVSIAALIATIIGVILVWVTFRETRRSDERQVRAYIGVEKSHLKYHRAEGFFDLHLVARNSGQTPAYRVAMTLEWTNQDELVHNVEIEQTDPGSMGTLSTNGEMHIQFRTNDATHPEHSLTASQCAEIYEGTRSLWVFGRIEYFDVFDKKRFTDFRYRTHRRGNQLHISVAYEGNDAN